MLVHLFDTIHINSNRLRYIDYILYCNGSAQGIKWEKFNKYFRGPLIFVV